MRAPGSWGFTENSTALSLEAEVVLFPALEKLRVTLGYPMSRLCDDSQKNHSGNIL